jgi:hypothetical protein
MAGSTSRPGFFVLGTNPASSVLSVPSGVKNRANSDDPRGIADSVRRWHRLTTPPPEWRHHEFAPRRACHGPTGRIVPPTLPCARPAGSGSLDSSVRRSGGRPDLRPLSGMRSACFGNFRGMPLAWTRPKGPVRSTAFSSSAPPRLCARKQRAVGSPPA